GLLPLQPPPPRLGLRARADAVGIEPSRGLGHGHGADRPAAEQRWQPAIARLRGAPAMQRARHQRRAQQRQWCAGAAELLAEQRGVEAALRLRDQLRPAELSGSAPERLVVVWSAPFDLLDVRGRTVLLQ